MKRIAAPMIGGIITSFLLELVVYPAIYEIWKWHTDMREAEAAPAASPQRSGDLTGPVGERPHKVSWIAEAERAWNTNSFSGSSSTATRPSSCC